MSQMYTCAVVKVILLTIRLKVNSLTSLASLIRILPLKRGKRERKMMGPFGRLCPFFVLEVVNLSHAT